MVDAPSSAQETVANGTSTGDSSNASTQESSPKLIHMPSLRNNNEVTEFLKKGCAVIIRMRGLPYDCTPKQILEFFASDIGHPSVPDHSVRVQDDESGIMFVMKADGRATGDAFVRFNTEQDAVKALSKHKYEIGSRYIELFRSTVAEVQQVVAKAMEPATPRQSSSASGILANGLLPNGYNGIDSTLPTMSINMPVVSLPQLYGMNGQAAAVGAAVPTSANQHVVTGNKKDCIRLRGLPFEAQVHHVLDFLGEFAKFIVFQGVHMVYNAQGHPSGEAFIQMESEQAAQGTAAERHNKYMQIGRKHRYIEVFQCSADDMSLTLATPISNTLAGAATLGTSQAGNLASPAALQVPGMPAAFGAQQRLPVSPMGVATNGLVPSTSATRPMNGLWPYPSPPVSPTNPLYAYAMMASQQQQQQALQALLVQQQQQQQAALAQALQQQVQQIQAQQVAQAPAHMLPMAQLAGNGPTTLLMRGLPPNTSTSDILAFFHSFVDLNADCIQIQRNGLNQPTGDALITFSTRQDAERAIAERNHHLLHQRQIELYVYC